MHNSLFSLIYENTIQSMWCTALYGVPVRFSHILVGLFLYRGSYSLSCVCACACTCKCTCLGACMCVCGGGGGGGYGRAKESIFGHITNLQCFSTNLFELNRWCPCINISLKKLYSTYLEVRC